MGYFLGGSVVIWVVYFCLEWVKGVVCVNVGGGIYLKEEFEKFCFVGEKLLDFCFFWLGRLLLLDLVFSWMMVEKFLVRKWGR